MALLDKGSDPITELLQMVGGSGGKLVMYSFGEKHPIIFEIILTTVSFLAAGIIVAATSLYMHPDLSSSIARVLVAVALLVIYRRAFRGQNPFTNLKIAIPLLLFAVWNLFYNLSSGMVIGGA